jgi:hypothetical protein
VNPKISADILSDNEGTEIGSPSNYIQRLKDEASGKAPSVPLTITDQKPAGKASSSRTRTPLPKEWSQDTEKDVLIHFYLRFGDESCEDFKTVCPKIAASINRYFTQTLSPEDVLKKLEQHVALEDVLTAVPEDTSQEETPEEPKEKLVKNKKIKVNLLSGKYDFVPNLEPLTDEEKDLVMFLDPKNLCFTSDGHDFYLALHPKSKNAFDNLFKFNAQEQMMVNMFKDQLGDEHQAKKMVLMSKMLNKPQRKKRKVTKKKSTNQSSS